MPEPGNPSKGAQPHRPHHFGEHAQEREELPQRPAHEAAHEAAPAGEAAAHHVDAAFERLSDSPAAAALEAPGELGAAGADSEATLL